MKTAPFFGTKHGRCGFQPHRFPRPGRCGFQPHRASLGNYRINLLIFIKPHRFLDCVSVFPVLVGMFCPRRSSLGDYRVLVENGAVANRSYRAWSGFWWKTERLQTAPTGVGGRDDGAGEWLQTAPTRSGAASDDPPTKKSP